MNNATNQPLPPMSPLASALDAPIGGTAQPDANLVTVEVSVNGTSGYATVSRWQANHVCGLQGFGRGIGSENDVCHRCEADRAAEEDARRRIAAAKKAEQAPPPATGTPARMLADDIRADGWAVAVHNDYRLNGETYTFWLFTKDERCVKGEGRTDADALEQIRTAIRQPAPVAAGGAGHDDFPTEIHICGQRYAIVPDGETVHAIHGMIVFDQGRIELNTQCDAELLRVTLLHEVIHGIDKMLVGEPGITSRLRGPVNDQLLRLTEPEVLALSQGLWMTLTDPRNRAMVDWMLGQSAGGAGHEERMWAVINDSSGVFRILKIDHREEYIREWFQRHCEYEVDARVVPVLVSVLADDAAPAAPAGAEGAACQLADDAAKAAGADLWQRGWGDDSGEASLIGKRIRPHLEPLVQRLAAAEAARAAAEGEATRLRTALTFYADKSQWVDGEYGYQAVAPIEFDKGERARAALAAPAGAKDGPA